MDGRLTKKEISFLYKGLTDLKGVVHDDVYRDISSVWYRREKEKKKEDYAVLYDCEEDQIVLRDEMDEMRPEKIFSGNIVYYDASLTLEGGTVPIGLIRNKVQFPLIVHGECTGKGSYFF